MKVRILLQLLMLERLSFSFFLADFTGKSEALCLLLL